LLWRSSRDGFIARKFQYRCDGCVNILTLILDTMRNFFVGFTSEKLESRIHNGKSGDDDNCLKGDNSLRSILFTLKNPQRSASREISTDFLNGISKYIALLIAWLFTDEHLIKSNPTHQLAYCIQR
jgi:hypothetical protein